MTYDPKPLFHSRHESEKIIEIANEVQENGTVFEIGTYLGGTANLLRKNTHSSVKIYSLDINQNSMSTKDKMAKNDVIFIDGTSRRIADKWDEKIDFLLIDGGHRLIDTIGDVNSWFPKLAKGTKVAFHDYDEPIAGGIYYIGVRTVVDTLIRCGAINNLEHNTTLLTGNIANENTPEIDVKNLSKTIELYSKNIVTVKNELSEKLLDWFLNGCSTKASRIFDSVKNHNLSIFKSNAEIHPICSMLNQMQFCYIFFDWIKFHTNDVIDISKKPDIILYLEMMTWLDAERRVIYPTECANLDIYSDKFYPDSTESYNFETIDQIGRFMLLEQVRLNMLSRVSNKLFDKLINNW